MVIAKTRYVRKKPTKENLIKRVIKEVHKEYLTIKDNGKKYNIPLSDKVILRVIHKNDTAIIDTDINKVVDIINQQKHSLSVEEEMNELARQEKELEDIGWGEY